MRCRLPRDGPDLTTCRSRRRIGAYTHHLVIARNYSGASQSFLIARLTGAKHDFKCSPRCSAATGRGL